MKKNCKKIKNISRFFNLILVTVVSFQISSDILKELNLPKGFMISIYADDLDSPRQITETNGGNIIVGSKNGDKLVAIVDEDKDGYAEKKIVIAEGLQNPTGVVFPPA